MNGIDNSIISALIGVVGSALIALAVGYIRIYRKVEINEERLNKLHDEKTGLLDQLADIRKTVYQIRDALLRDNKL